MTKVDAATGAVTSIWGSLTDVATDFYYNAVRSYMQLGAWDAQLLELYGETIEAARRQELFKEIGGKLHVRSYNTKKQLHAFGMEDTGCLLGGMLALSSLVFSHKKVKHVYNSSYSGEVEDPRALEHLKLAENITETCYQAANSTKTKLLPNKFILNKILSNETWIALVGFFKLLILLFIFTFADRTLRKPTLSFTALLAKTSTVSGRGSWLRLSTVTAVQRVVVLVT